MCSSRFWRTWDDHELRRYSFSLRVVDSRKSAFLMKDKALYLNTLFPLYPAGGAPQGSHPSVAAGWFEFSFPFRP